ncbi:hypothetical protein Vafri_463 [Volvox africanus]|nr:hypothetical protein Vafri_463 [Volvox africanus]
MEQSMDELRTLAAVDALEIELRRLGVGAAESQTTVTLNDDAQEEDSSSSSSESSVALPTELYTGDGTRSGPQQTLAPSAPIETDTAVGLLYDQSMEQHFGPADHFERPARIIQLHATLNEQGLMDRCWHLVPRQATDEELLLGHSEEHIRKVDSMFSELYPSRPETLADANYCYADGRMGDVYICTGTARAARFAAGCCVQAVQAVLSGAVRRVMAVVRPPGHHAECERAMGFCFFNNVAIAALSALQQPGIRRVAVLDWDVHHGNGIQNMLLQRPDALYISIHRDPKRFYPYTTGFVGEAGEGAGTGFNVNVPWLKKGMGDGDYVAAFSLIVEPLLESYQPDLVIVAAGFDAADGDPLGGCKVSPEGYAWMTERLMRFARGRLVMALEGGYNNRVTSWCAAACVRTLLQGTASPPLPQDKEHMWPAEAYNSLKAVYEFQRQHWPVLRSRSWTEAWEAHIKDVTRMLGESLRAKRASAGSNNGASAFTATAASTQGSGATGNGVTLNTGRDESGRSASGPSQLSSSGRSDGDVTVHYTDSACSSTNDVHGNCSGPPPPPPPPQQSPQSLQEAFKARKAARDAAAAAAATAGSGTSSPLSGSGAAAVPSQVSVSTVASSAQGLPQATATASIPLI